MEENRIARVVGLSSSVLLDPDDPYDPINRRVSIIVMNKKAEEAAARDGGSIEVDDAADLEPLAPAAQPGGADDAAESGG
jgi:chemotaxis protein MotB